MTKNRLEIDKAYGKIVVTVMVKYGIDISIEGNTTDLSETDGIFLTWEDFNKIVEFAKK